MLFEDSLRKPTVWQEIEMSICNQKIELNTAKETKVRVSLLTTYFDLVEHDVNWFKNTRELQLLWNPFDLQIFCRQTKSASYQFKSNLWLTGTWLTWPRLLIKHLGFFSLLFFFLTSKPFTLNQSFLDFSHSLSKLPKYSTNPEKKKGTPPKETMYSAETNFKGLTANR